MLRSSPARSLTLSGPTLQRLQVAATSSDPPKAKSLLVVLCPWGLETVAEFAA